MVHDATGGRRTPARPEADKEKDSAQRAEEDKPKKIVRIQDQQGSESVPNVQTFEVQDLPDALREQLEAYRVGNEETVLELEQEASVYQTQTPEPAISAKERHNLRAICSLFGKLVKLELFSYAGYIQHLIARGESGLSTNDVCLLIAIHSALVDAL